jgi:hypothetical protein
VRKRLLTSFAFLALTIVPVRAADIWVPSLGASFSWVLGDASEPPVADVIDLDLFDTQASRVAALKAKGAHVVCYINVGAFEDWRPDIADFPEAVIGKQYEGWPGERWLDIRQIETLAPVLRARFDLCKKKGFDAIEPDNLDGFEQNSGFPISRDDQIRFNRWIAGEAHQRGLSIGLKNVPDLIPELLPYYDWALLEDCYDQDWCADFSTFPAKGKAVFSVEYTDNKINFAAFCRSMSKLRFTGLLKNRNLDGFERRCPI